VTYISAVTISKKLGAAAMQCVAHDGHRPLLSLIQVCAVALLGEESIPIRIACAELEGRSDIAQERNCHTTAAAAAAVAASLILEGLS
jgi:hypothetical protein